MRVFLLLVTVLQATEANVIGAFVLPHGGLLLEPDRQGGTARAAAHRIRSATLELGKRIADMEPDLIFLTTPHGINTNKQFLLYDNMYAVNYDKSLVLSLNNDRSMWTGDNARLRIESQATRDFYSFLAARNHTVIKLKIFGGSEAPLRWGESIPLWFLSDSLRRARLIVMSVPYNPDGGLEKLQEFGSDAFQFLDSVEKPPGLSGRTGRPQKVVVVVSGDLAHTHLRSGRYGYSEAALPFDAACGRWVETMNGTHLLETAAGLEPKAGSCGFNGMVLLHGLISSSGTQWRSQLHANEAPTYFGMLTASFERVL